MNAHRQPVLATFADWIVTSVTGAVQAAFAKRPAVPGRDELMGMGDRELSDLGIGRSEVLICKVTNKNTALQMASGPFWVPPVEKMTDFKKRSEKNTAMIHEPTASVPMKPNESVDSAKIQTAGAKPSNSNPASASAPARQAASCEIDTRAPANVAKM